MRSKTAAMGMMGYLFIIIGIGIAILLGLYFTGLLGWGWQQETTIRPSA